MSVARALYHLMLADFLERIRRYSFLIVLAAIVVIGYSMVPSIDDSYNALAIGDYRPYYSSAWVGTVFGMVVATILTLFGFFVIRDAVSRDYRTRVGQIIATTPVNRPVYLLGKWLSNLAVFVTMLIVLTIVALAMQLIRAEDLRVDILALAAPIWLMGLPTLALVAAISVLLECVRIPKGIANVAFVGLWMWMLLVSVGPIIVRHGEIPPSNDIAGISSTMAGIRQTMLDTGLDPSQGVTDLYQPTNGRETVRFAWTGISWNTGILLQRLFWIALAILIALIAAIPFDRFDPARWRVGSAKKRKQKKAVPADIASESLDSRFLPDVIRLSPLTQGALSSRFSSTVLAELYLMLKARSWWWYSLALGLFIACLVTSDRLSHRFFAPLAWLWPMLLWSGMGSAEQTHRTSQIIFSTAHIVRRQLPALWFAGVVVAVLLTGASAIRFVLAGEWFMLSGWLVGIVFVPSLALALGVWTNSGRTFEIAYFAIWFLGIWGHVSILDFMARSGTTSAVTPFGYLVITALLLLLTVLGRQKQIMMAFR